MAESRIKPENYITIQGWMKSELGLKNNRLLLYALLWGFSQDGKSGYTGRQDYLMEWLDCSRSALNNYIKELKDKGLLMETVAETGQKALRAVRVAKCPNFGHDVQKMDMGCPDSGHGDVQKMDMGCPDSGLLPIYNNSYKNTYIESDIGEFTPPTVEEVREYCLERRNGIDPQRFVDYYTADKWIRNGSPIDDWRLIVRLWESNGRDDAKKTKKTEQSGFHGGSFDTDDMWAAAVEKAYGG